MEEKSKNIYKNARRTAGYTQERWAEAVGVSVDALRQYELGRTVPPDSAAVRMAEVAALPVLGYWHLKEKSGIANDILPEVEVSPLPQAVLKLLVEMQILKPQIDSLVHIAADGLVSQAELGEFLLICGELDKVIQAALAVKYAEGTVADEV